MATDDYFRLVKVGGWQGHFEEVEAEIRNGVDFNGFCTKGGFKGWNALLAASLNSKVRVVQLLLESGANWTVTCQDENEMYYNKTPLQIAKDFDRDGVVRVIEGWLDKSHRDRMQIIAMSVDSKVMNVDATWPSGRLVDEGGYRGKLDVIMEEIACFKDVNGFFQGWTALMAASYSNHPKAVRLLLECGAKTNLRCRDLDDYCYNFTAEDLANSMKAYEAIEVVKEWQSLPTDDRELLMKQSLEEKLARICKPWQAVLPRLQRENEEKTNVEKEKKEREEKSRREVEDQIRKEEQDRQWRSEVPRLLDIDEITMVQQLSQSPEITSMKGNLDVTSEPLSDPAFSDTRRTPRRLANRSEREAKRKETEGLSSRESMRSLSPSYRSPSREHIRSLSRQNSRTNLEDVEFEKMKEQLQRQEEEKNEILRQMEQLKEQTKRLQEMVLTGPQPGPVPSRNSHDDVTPRTARQSGPIKALEELTEEETCRLLGYLKLGTFPFVCPIFGEMLCEFRSETDVLEVCPTMPRVATRMLLRKLEDYKANGVPSAFFAQP